LIRAKISEYLGRAEMLKEHLAQADEKRVRRPMGANGVANGGAKKCVLSHVVFPFAPRSPRSSIYVCLPAGRMTMMTRIQR